MIVKKFLFFLLFFIYSVSIHPKSFGRLVAFFLCVFKDLLSLLKVNEFTFIFSEKIL